MMPDRLIGLGCMRMSTSADRDDGAAVRVIHTALDAGIRLLDTADSYCLDDADRGHNERLIAGALRSWSGDARTITVATKGGLRRPAGRWVPDGRAGHLRDACEASCRALGVDCIELYQLHAVDPRTRLETSVRALAALQHEGLIRHIGLCNVTVNQIEVARAIIDVAAVQVPLNILDHNNLRNGVAEYCNEHRIPLIAYRPLAGRQAQRIAKDPLLSALAAAHSATAHEVALAWLLDLDPSVIPVPGATRTETAKSIARALAIELTETERGRLDDRFEAGRLLRVPRSRRRAPDNAEGEVVMVMGMPGAGKTRLAAGLVQNGYERLNRDERGGLLRGLVSDLDAGLQSGRRRWVLDNTYPLRASRNEVIECAWKHGVPVRCIWLDTSLADAQINAITRLIEAHGHLPSVEEMRALSREDVRYIGPDAQFRYQRQLELPVAAEGFTVVERRTFKREPATGSGRALVLEYDEVLATGRAGTPVLEPAAVELARDRRDRLRRYAEAGWTLFAIAWRPQIATGETSEEAVRACFDRTREILGVDIEFSFCPHPAGPPVCWCRKPLPGLVLDFALRRQIALDASIVVGRSAADRTMAERLGMPCFDHVAWFADPSADVQAE